MAFRRTAINSFNNNSNKITMKQLLTILLIAIYTITFGQSGYTNVPAKQWQKDTVLNTKAMKINSQGGLVVGTYDLNGNAILELNSTTKGFLPTRLNTTQQNAITSPANGLTIYNTDSNALVRYDAADGWRMYHYGSIGGGTSYTFDNGLTETGGAVELGAPLTRSTTVSGIGYTFKQPSAYAAFVNGYDTVFGFSLPFVGFKKYKSPTLFTTIGMINVGTFGGDTADLYFGDLDYTGAKSTRLRISSTTGSADLTALKNIVLSPDSALTINTGVLNENIAGRISTHADSSINIQSDKSVIISSEENGSIDAAASSSVTLTVHPWEAGLFNYWGATNPNSINANIYTGKTYPSLGGGILDWNSWFVGSDTTTGFSASGMYQLRTPATDSFDSNKHLIDIKSDSLKIVFNANSSNRGGLALRFDDSGLSVLKDSAEIVDISPSGVVTASNFSRSFSTEAYGSSVVQSPSIGYYTFTSGTGTAFFDLDLTAPIGTEVIIKDGLAQSATNNIIVDSGTGNSIVGSTIAQTYTINSNGASISLKRISSTTWEVF